MNKILGDIATEMSKEATKVFEEYIDIPQSAIVKLPAWDNYTDETVYVCQHEGLLIVAYVENDITITEVSVKLWDNYTLHLKENI